MLPERTSGADGARALLPAALAGVAAAVVGGVVWGLIVKTTEYEVGFVAWGIGWLCGTAAVFGARGRRGLPLQVTAVAAALLGILVGKYLSFVWSFNDAAEEEGLPISLGLLSGDSFDLFTDREGGVWSWFDLLWIGLAVFTAWRLTQRAEAAPEQPGGEAAPPEERG